MATDTKTEADNIKTEYNSIFGGASTDKVGDIGTINDGTYNVPWVIYDISGNTYKLFPLKNLTDHVMNSNGYNDDGYTVSEMYTYVHNTVLPNLKKSGLNITACDLVSESVYDDICSKTGKTSATIVGGEFFWLTNPYRSYHFYNVYSDGSINYFGINASYSFGVRPLITVVKD